MDRDLTRRGLIAAIVGGTAVGGLVSPVRSYLRGFAPLSGRVWADATDDRRRDLAGPYGEATVRVDAYGVPHVEADTESAAYYAIGYLQAVDRLFQLDLQRRVMRGRLSEVVGPATLESDEFNRRMNFVGGAEASWRAIEGTEVGDLLEAYAEGVNARIDEGRFPPEFGLLDFEPDPWSPIDTLLMELQISWGLTGSFRTLRKARAREQLGEAATEELCPDRIDHDSPILREGPGAPGTEAIDPPRGLGRDSAHTGGIGSGPIDSGAIDSGRTDPETIDPEFLSWLSSFESPPGIGSNSWVVSGEYTESGEPFVANDPHLELTAPPLWYEQHVSTPGADVRGMTFPGVPFVIIGANHNGAWGFTNAGADVIDFYTYETDEDGDRYRYRGEWREFRTDTETIEVAGGENRAITTRETVHGPILERHGSEVAVAWTGHAATRTVEAIHRFAHSDDLDEFLDGVERFDLPTQCLVYADRDGRTLFYVTGRVPIRRIDGDPVPGNQIFDGSAGHGEWAGYEPFGATDWDGPGFIPFEEMPHRIDPDYVGTANQRIVGDDRFDYYLAESYSTPERGARLYELLDDRLAPDGDGESAAVDVASLREPQLDTYDRRADAFLPIVEEAVAGTDLESDARPLLEWDGHMDRDSDGALLFDLFVEEYRTVLLAQPLSEAGLEGQFPSDWVLARLDPDGRWFDAQSREATVREALQAAIERREELDATVYGDLNTTGAIVHPFELEFLNYPAYPTDGSSHALMNFRRRSAVGASLRFVWSPDGSSEVILPGGNSGRYFSDHYDDQLRAWADGEYRSMALEPAGEVRYTFGRQP